MNLRWRITCLGIRTLFLRAMKFGSHFLCWWIFWNIRQNGINWKKWEKFSPLWAGLVKAGVLKLWPVSQMQPAEQLHLACKATHRSINLVVGEWGTILHPDKTTHPSPLGPGHPLPLLYQGQAIHTSLLLGMGHTPFSHATGLGSSHAPFPLCEAGFWSGHAPFLLHGARSSPFPLWGSVGDSLSPLGPYMAIWCRLCPPRCHIRTTIWIQAEYMEYALPNWPTGQKVGHRKAKGFIVGRKEGENGFKVWQSEERTELWSPIAQLSSPTARLLVKWISPIHTLWILPFLFLQLL